MEAKLFPIFIMQSETKGNGELKSTKSETTIQLAIQENNDGDADWIMKSTFNHLARFFYKR
jgi:hypothetical protein